MAGAVDRVGKLVVTVLVRIAVLVVHRQELACQRFSSLLEYSSYFSREVLKGVRGSQALVPPLFLV
jgi:hypothetical protein